MDPTSSSHPVSSAVASCQALEASHELVLYMPSTGWKWHPRPTSSMATSGPSLFFPTREGQAAAEQAPSKSNRAAA
eukprot:CAMPEP_0172598724 /NCGR_PEP_ID=MMETSP1068-20121228/18792_1 /TAXON_ID=35684 /ORGANISM="Pseudopedinella elastica, Strain CCMP716" /LENGTH=75 /DNA_ID=CAMNT_0013398705 /DNA_START=202 /DNA_END=429 /DNA_ORIENTATION=+